VLSQFGNTLADSGLQAAGLDSKSRLHCMFGIAAWLLLVL
jgi:hypothetical protein